MKRYVFIIVLFLMSCGDNLEVETVSLDEILPQSIEYTKTNDVESPLEKDSNTVYRNALQAAYSDSLLVFLEGVSQQKYLPDRLTSISREQSFIRAGDDTLVYTSWQFVDSLTTVNAFYNWLDCYGEDCSEVRIGEIKNVTEKCVFTAVSTAHLIHIECPENYDITTWRSRVVSFLYPEEKWIYGFSQQRGKGMKWYFVTQ